MKNGDRERERERYKHRQEWGREREGDRMGERKIETQAGVGERKKDSSTNRSAGDRQSGRERR